MLNQLTRLSVDTDGRYATERELQFLKNYLASKDSRISAYEKIRDAEDAIMDEVEAQVKSIDPNVFVQGSKDLTSMGRRDCSYILKCLAAAMLINDLDRLRDSVLVWHRSIIHAVQTDKISKTMWQVVPGVIKQYLTPEEADLLMPALRLNQTLLG